MPAPNPKALGDTARRHFNSKRIALPVDWHEMGPLYPQAFTPSEQQSQPTPADNLFYEPTRNRYHVDSARVIGRSMANYIDGVCAAICSAISRWMQMASVASATINGPVGMLSPGGVTGPGLAPLIRAKAPQKTGMETEYSDAIAKAVGDAWAAWQKGLTGVLSYPSFASAPNPAAPPTPNIPAPLISFGSAGESALAPSALSRAMAAAMTADGQHAGALFDVLARAFHSHFQTFKTVTLVTGVIAAGPVGGIPSGPVVSGGVIPSPGNFV